MTGDVVTTTATASSHEVYELVGRARAHLLSARRAEAPDAVRAFNTAIALDPTHAPAHAGLAFAHCAEAEWRLAAPSEALPHLERAIDARDPCLVDLAVSPQWGAFRGDSRFRRCLTDLHLPH